MKTLESRRRREEGSALIVAMMMLVMMGLIGLASLQTVGADRKVAGFRVRTTTAFAAADAGVSAAMGQLRSDIGFIRSGGIATLTGYNPAFADTALGDATSYPAGQPQFGADPAATGAIQYLGRGEMCDWVTSLDEKVIWQKTLWDIRVEGQTASGTANQIQAVAGVCRPFNTNY